AGPAVLTTLRLTWSVTASVAVEIVSCDDWRRVRRVMLTDGTHRHPTRAQRVDHLVRTGGAPGTLGDQARLEAGRGGARLVTRACRTRSPMPIPSTATR